MKVYLVWNEAKTEGFATTDQQLAYEIRKGATSNAFDAEGNYSHAGVAFANVYMDDACTTEVIETSDTDEITPFDLARAQAGEPIERAMPFGDWVDAIFVGVLSDGRIVVETQDHANALDCVSVYAPFGLRMK